MRLGLPPEDHTSNRSHSRLARPSALETVRHPGRRPNADARGKIAECQEPPASSSSFSAPLRPPPGRGAVARDGPAADHARGAVADEARRLAGGVARRPVGRLPGDGARLRREEGDAGPVGRPRRRLREGAAADRPVAPARARRPGAPTAGGSRSRRSATTTRSRRSTCSTSWPAAKPGASRRRRSRRAARSGARTGRRSPTRAPSTRGRRTSRATGSSPPSARRRSRRSAATSRSRSGAGTSGSTRRGPTSSSVSVDGDAPARDLLAGTKLAGGGGVRGRLWRGLERRPAAGVRPGRPLPGDRGLRQPVVVGLRPDEHPPLRGAARRRRAARADLGDLDLRLARVLARRRVPLRPRLGGVGTDLRPRPSRLRGVAVDRRARSS